MQDPGGRPDVDPAELGQLRIAVDVPVALSRIGPVVLALEVDADPILRPADIDAREQAAALVVHRNLRLRPRKAVLHEKQSGQRLVRRLRTTVHEFQRLAELPQPARTGMTLCDRRYLGGLDEGCVEKCVEVLQPAFQRQASTEVECGTRRCCHPHALHETDLGWSQRVWPVDGKRTVEYLAHTVASHGLGSRHERESGSRSAGR
jgi:hypothetical protein